MKLIYICSPFSGDVEGNIKRAQEYCKEAIRAGYTPIAPHLLYPQILDDTNSMERELGIQMGLNILEICDEIWVFGQDLTAGMDREVKFAKQKNIPVIYKSIQEQSMAMVFMQ